MPPLATWKHLARNFLHGQSMRFVDDDEIPRNVMNIAWTTVCRLVDEAFGMVVGESHEWHIF
jgi:hypothetical protein